MLRVKLSWCSENVPLECSYQGTLFECSFVCQVAAIMWCCMLSTLETLHKIEPTVKVPWGLMIKGQSHSAMWWIVEVFPGKCRSESVPEAITSNPVLLLVFFIHRKRVVTHGVKFCNANLGFSELRWELGAEICWVLCRGHNGEVLLPNQSAVSQPLGHGVFQLAHYN